MSLYANYIKEREDKEIIENDCGFITYKIFRDQKECMICDLYVLPEYRKNKIASEMANTVSNIAKNNDCNCLTAQVDTLALNCTDSLKVILAYGFKILSCNSRTITLVKELK